VLFLKVKIIQTVSGSPDGITIVEYKAGEIYDIPEKLAINFIQDQKKAIIAPLEDQFSHRPENIQTITKVPEININNQTSRNDKKTHSKKNK